MRILLVLALATGLAGLAPPDARATDPDNTAVNERDRSGATLTPADQGGSESDLRITQSIRQALMDEELSMNARNAKVITVDGMVTLRGPVENEGERQRIAELARGVTGVRNVDNQLEVSGD
jgi:osmotically-inducible protein OsmY